MAGFGMFGVTGVWSSLRRHRATILLALLLAVWFSIAGTASAATTRSNRERSVDCTAQIIVETRFGTTRRCTGMLYNSSGYVVTTFHAIADAESILVFHAKHGVFSVDRVLRVDQRTDTALLALRDWPYPTLPVARLVDDTQLKPGDTLFVLHHPAAGAEVVYQSELISRGVARQYSAVPFTTDYAPEVVLLELSGPFDAGSAGGLVCSSDFNVVGMLIGGVPSAGGNTTGYAISATYLTAYLASSYDVGYSRLQTTATGDADAFETFFGPAPPRLAYDGPMTEGYLVWFSRICPVNYDDREFTAEINDKIEKNWFYTAGLEVDARPVTEISASRFYVCPVLSNPWGFQDSTECFVHFDADSLFAKRVYTVRELEERIMTRYLMAMPLNPGSHALVYENQGANLKSTGIVRKRVTIESGRIQTIDIQGLSVVNMQQLPVAPPSVGGKPAVRYEIERRQVGDRELNDMIRQARVGLS